MTNKTVKLLTKAAPESLLKVLTQKLSKEEYEDKDIKKLFDSIEEKIDQNISDLEKLNYLNSFSEFYELGEKDLYLVENNRYLEKIELEKIKKAELEERAEKKQGINLLIQEEEKKKLKEIFEAGLIYLDLEKLMNENKNKKAFLLELFFEEAEEKHVPDVPFNIVNMMKTKEEKKQLEEILERRTPELQEEIRTNLEIREWSEKTFQGKDPYFDETSEEYVRFFFEEIMKKLTPPLTNLLNNDKFKEMDESWTKEYLDEPVRKELFKVLSLSERAVNPYGFQDEDEVGVLNMGKLFNYVVAQFSNWNETYSFPLSKTPKEIIEFAKSYLENGATIGYVTRKGPTETIIMMEQRTKEVFREKASMSLRTILKLNDEAKNMNTLEKVKSLTDESMKKDFENIESFSVIVEKLGLENEKDLVKEYVRKGLLKTMSRKNFIIVLEYFYGKELNELGVELTPEERENVLYELI